MPSPSLLLRLRLLFYQGYLLYLAVSPRIHFHHIHRGQPLDLIDSALPSSVWIALNRLNSPAPGTACVVLTTSAPRTLTLFDIESAACSPLALLAEDVRLQGLARLHEVTKLWM
ncbi:hypothetical protein C8R47DRAFT_1206849 [Mycena vitilis]|nr:hypothetical protein C8R47DRAFT_1206849 [Mycena vitilis]